MEPTQSEENFYGILTFVNNLELTPNYEACTGELFAPTNESFQTYVHAQVYEL